MVLNDCPESETIGCGFSAFKEIDEVTFLITELKKVDLSPSLIEKNRDRFNFILSQYQDQRQLLDPYLDDILQPLISIIRDENSTEIMRHNAFKYIFIVMSVKTYKKIVTYLPHEVCRCFNFFNFIFSPSFPFSLSLSLSLFYILISTYIF